jgi:DHA2 family multidrug resistance protein-like MFS transporter
VLLLVTAPFLLPEYRDSKAGRIDLVSVALSLVTILPVVYGLKEVAKNGVEPAALAAVAVGLGFGLAFIARQRRLADPLLDLSLFANPSFRVAVGGMFLVTVTGASMLYTNQYLQLVLGYSPLVSGLLSLPAMVTSAGGFLLAPIVAKYLRPSVLIGSGLVLSAVGSALLLTTTVESGVVALIVGSTLSSIGFAPMVTLSSGIVMGSVQPEKAGSAAALQETCSELGFGLGIASLGSLGGVIYRALVPADVAGAARDHLAGAVAANLPPETLFAAREAFLAGMHAVVLITTGVTLLVAIVAFVAFRHLPPLGQQTADAPADEALPQAA